MKLLEHSLAIAFAIKVLPQPVGIKPHMMDLIQILHIYQDDLMDIKSFLANFFLHLLILQYLPIEHLAFLLKFLLKMKDLFVLKLSENDHLL